MTKNAEQYEKFEIEWNSLPSLRLGQRPGVEFHYQSQRGLVIGFMEGHEWNQKNSGLCKIYTLAEDSKEWGDLQPEAHAILDKLKECIYQVLRQHRILGPIQHDIFAWPNPEQKRK